MRSRALHWLSFLTLMMLIGAGCAPRAGSGEIADIAGEGALVLDMPALVISFDEAGKPNLGNVPLADLAGASAAGALEAVQVDADTLDFLMANNIQHVQINNRINGLSLLVNGKPVPSLKWDEASLQGTTETLAMLGGGASVVQDLLPMIRQLGIGVVVRFPVAAGAEEIPLAGAEAANETVASMQQAQEEFLSSAGSAPTINIPVYYNPDGSWIVSDLTDSEYSTILPQVPWQNLRLLPDALQDMVDAGISEITVSTNAEGIFLSINGNTLPHIGWGEGELVNVLELGQQMGLLDSLSAGGMDPTELVTAIEGLVPIVQAANISITAHLPDSEAMAAANQ